MSGRIDVVRDDQGPVEGETIFAVEYLVRWSEHTGGTLRPVRRQQVETLEEGESLCSSWQADWPKSDLTKSSGKRWVVGGVVQIAQRRGFVMGLVNHDGESALWPSVREYEQRRWPFRLRLIAG